MNFIFCLSTQGCPHVYRVAGKWYPFDFIFYFCRYAKVKMLKIASHAVLMAIFFSSSFLQQARGCRRFDCLTVWLRDCVTVWLCDWDCVTVGLHDCETVWPRDCLTEWLCACITLWSCDCVTMWLCKSVNMWLRGRVHMTENNPLIWVYCNHLRDKLLSYSCCCGIITK